MRVTLVKKSLIRLSISLSFIITTTLSIHTIAAESSLASALPGTAALTKQEECTAKQHKIMASIGLGKTACTLSKYISFDSLGQITGTSAFQPNSRNNPLNPSDNVEDFVRYSPGFFTRINELYLKDSDNFIYGFIYKHFLINSTRLFYIIGKDMREHKNSSTLTMAQYKQAVNNSKDLYTTSVAQCKQTQVNITKTFGARYQYTETFSECGKSGTATLFWYRRQLDGSGDALFTLLDTVLKTQDQEFYSQLKLAVKAKESQKIPSH